MIKRILIVLMVFLPLLFPLSVNAAESGKDVILPKDEIVNQDYFAAGNTVTIAGTVNGDAYVAGGTVDIEGTINGDLLVAAGTIHLRGKVANNIRILGGDIVISGTVGRNASIAAGSVTVADNASLQGSFTAAAGTLTIFAPIAKEAVIASGQAIVGNSIGNDLTAAVSQLTLSPQASISGNLSYWSQQDLTLQQGASVSGKINKHQLPVKNEFISSKLGTFLATLFGIIKLANFIISFIVGWLLLRFFPTLTNTLIDSITKHPLRSFLLGLLTVLFIPAFILILFVVIIGIPLAIVLFAFLLLYWFFANIFVAIFLGEKILGYIMSGAPNILILLTGFIFIEILAKIPILGPIISIIFLGIGIGAIIQAKYYYIEKLRSKKLI